MAKSTSSENLASLELSKAKRVRFEEVTPHRSDSHAGRKLQEISPDEMISTEMN